MSLGIADIDEKRRLKNNYLDASPEVLERMYSLEEYMEIAKRCIGHFASPSLAKELLRNEDAIHFITEHLMHGTCRWNPERGRNLRSYHNQCALWAIKVWMRKAKNNRNKQLKSLHHEISHGEKTLLYETIADEKALEAYEELYDNKEIDRSNATDQVTYLLNNSNLTERQAECVQMRYLDGMKYSEIGAKLGIRRQAVEFHVQNALKKMRLAGLMVTN